MSIKELCWPQHNYNKIQYTLQPIVNILTKFGNPQLKIKNVIHVGGTNGKGSTTAFTKAIAEAAGYKVNRYTSPHLLCFNERIEISGQPIVDQLFLDLMAECKRMSELHNIDLSIFEALTAVAILAFSEEDADLTILEVGMGGKLDATNIIATPLASIITSISLDHIKMLGPTLIDIASNKAAIMKYNCLTIIDKQEDLSVKKYLQDYANYIGSNALCYNSEWFVRENKNEFTIITQEEEIKLPWPSLKGRHQLYNCAGAVMAMISQKTLEIDMKAVEEGIVNTEWSARLQKITDGKLYALLPKGFELWIDGAHNEDGCKKLAQWIEESKMIRPMHNHAIIGILNTKDVKTITQIICSVVDEMTAIKFDNNKASDPIEIISYAKTIHNNVNVSSNIEEAITKVDHSKGMQRVIICGSLYLMGEVLSKNS